MEQWQRTTPEWLQSQVLYLRNRNRLCFRTCTNSQILVSNRSYLLRNAIFFAENRSVKAAKKCRGLPLTTAACGARTNSSTSPNSHNIVEEEFLKRNVKVNPRGWWGGRRWGSGGVRWSSWVGLQVVQLCMETVDVLRPWAAAETHLMNPRMCIWWRKVFLLPRGIVGQRELQVWQEWRG